MRHYRSAFARLLATAVTTVLLLGGPSAASASDPIFCAGAAGHYLICV